LPRSLLPRLPQHLLFDLGGVLIGQIERLRIEDARFGQRDPTVLHRRQRTPQPSN
jgi:hypothetical protein